MASCSLRLLSESPLATGVSTNATSPPVVSAACGTASTYSRVPCDTPLMGLGGAVPVVFMLDSKNGTRTRFSVLATPAPDVSTAASWRTFVDADETLPESRDTIDMFSLRIVNGAGAGVDVHGVVDECHNCALPPLWVNKEGTSRVLDDGDERALRATRKYGWKISYNVTSGGGNATGGAVALPRLAELGAYTLVLHSGACGAPPAAPTLLVDVAGRNAELPLA